MVSSSTRKRLPGAALLLLGSYWLAAFVGTHVPPRVNLPLGSSDKWLHFGAYAGLALLASLNWWLRGRFRWRQGLALWGLLAAWGALDEVTQIPVGRECDVFDWLADTAGSLAGLAVFLAGATLWRRWKRSGVADQKLAVGGR